MTPKNSRSLEQCEHHPLVLDNSDDVTKSVYCQSAYSAGSSMHTYCSGGTYSNTLDADVQSH